MSLLSVIAFITGTLGVWLTIRQTIWCWPVSLVSVVTLTAEFYFERLYGDMALQVFYFFAGLYGWIFWKRNSGKPFRVSKMPARIWLLLCFATVFQAIVYYYIISYFRGDRAMLDAVLTAASLTATYMMTRKWIQNWICWVLIDATYIYLYVSKEMWLVGLLYFLFTALAFYGWRNWKRNFESSAALSPVD